MVLFPFDTLKCYILIAIFQTDVDFIDSNILIKLVLSANNSNLAVTSLGKLFLQNLSKIRPSILSLGTSLITNNQSDRAELTYTH